MYNPACNFHNAQCCLSQDSSMFDSAVLVTSKVSSKVPALWQTQVFSLQVLTALFAGGRSRGARSGLRACVVEFSGGFLFTAAERGFGLGPKKVQECGLWIRCYAGPQPPLPGHPHLLARCCRRDRSRGAHAGPGTHFSCCANKPPVHSRVPRAPCWC